MEKKGQLTIFIILGIVIAAVVIGLFVIGTDSFFEPVYDEKITILKDNVVDCFEENYKVFIDGNSFSGGYYERPSISRLTFYDLEYSFVPYYYDQGESLLPTREVVEYELSKAAEENIGICIDNYFDSETEFVMNYDSIDVTTTILEDQVLFVADIDVTVEYDNTSVIVEFSRDEVYVESQLQGMLEVAEIVVRQAVTDEFEWIDLTELYFAVEERDLNLTISDIEEVSEVYLFTVTSQSEEFYPLNLNFMMRYNLKEIDFPDGAS